MHNKVLSQLCSGNVILHCLSWGARALFSDHDSEVSFTNMRGEWHSMLL